MRSNSIIISRFDILCSCTANNLWYFDGYVSVSYKNHVSNTKIIEKRYQIWWLLEGNICNIYTNTRDSQPICKTVEDLFAFSWKRKGFDAWFIFQRSIVFLIFIVNFEILFEVGEGKRMDTETGCSFYILHYSALFL